MITVIALINLAIKVDRFVVYDIGQTPINAGITVRCFLVVQKF